MKTYVVSKTGAYIPTRPTTIVPKLYLYMGFNYVVKTGPGAWSLCVVPDGVAVPAAAQSDPDIIIIPESNLDNTISGAARNNVNAQLSTTDLMYQGAPLQVGNGETIREFFTRLGVALGHTEDFIFTI